MNPDGYDFCLELAVRDYELDYQGIVNNANYLHYLEHTRHEYCRSKGVTFADLHRAGIDPVLSHIEISYKQPLKADDVFYSCLRLSRKGPKFVFDQDIYRQDDMPVLKAVVTVACLENGVLTRGDALAEKFGI